MEKLEASKQREQRSRRVAEPLEEHRKGTLEKAVDNDEKWELVAGEEAERREYLAKFYGEPVAEKRKQRTADELQEYERKQKRDQRARETPEERERRLQKMRDYSASRSSGRCCFLGAAFPRAASACEPRRR